MNVAAQQRLTLENALRRAIENREFELHYQPLHDLRDRSITGVEALIRWNRPDHGLVSPGEFIAVAEDSGLIVPIGEWVLREALRQARAWHAEGRPLRMAVNVSANQLARPSFADRLRRLLEETGVDPSLVELEVTEGVIVEGAGEAREAIDQIAALGVGIAIDDFGTGYSGLAYLKRLPIDTVKIDQSFVRDLTIDPDDAAIVTAIVAMARSLGRRRDRGGGRDRGAGRRVEAPGVLPRAGLPAVAPDARCGDHAAAARRLAFPPDHRLSSCAPLGAYVNRPAQMPQKKGRCRGGSWCVRANDG
jgi:EAL domain-containing protein (putative c-di-GMP-specific phosphodiesterase class I)